ncbi:hypothetical protein SUGI_0797310 [Cryptomeria japonica]|nr:hypothetical protein SUGI_0797310 [Cryptomeria japonica]
MIDAWKAIIFEDFTYMGSNKSEDVEEEIMPKLVGNHLSSGSKEKFIGEASEGRSELVGSVIISGSDKKRIRAVMNVDGEEMVVMDGIQDVGLPLFIYSRS